MGTNYYRIPTVEEMEQRKAHLQKRIEEMEMNPENIERGFHNIPVDNWEFHNPWTEFIENTNVHLGKRSGGWKFLWNFHNDKYYHNQESLFEFINSGRVVNEYGEEIPGHEFIEMALTWGGNWDNGVWDTESYYKDNPTSFRSGFETPEYYVDGLRTSNSTNFS